MDMTIKEFCDKHNACEGGRKWALSCGANAMQELWLRDDMKHDWRMWIMARKGVLTHTECIRFACWSVRQVWPLLTDERSRKAIEVTEAFLDGKATIKDVEDATYAAYAAYAAAYAAANATTYAAYAANAAANAANATTYAAYAAYAAAYAAANATTYAAYAAAQDKWLIENAKPNFGKGK